MISEQDKQAILNGAYGITRSGVKVKHLFTSNLNTNGLMYLFVSYEKERGKEAYSNSAYWVTKDFTFFVDKESCGNDIVKLWEDKPEPFDLQRALAGEPVMLRNGSKANILKQIKDTLIGYFDECSPFSWGMNGDGDRAADSNHDIIGMWKDPEPVSNTVTLTLPCPLKEPKDEMWFIKDNGVILKSGYLERDPSRTYNRDKLNAGFYFGSKEDAQAWLDAMKKNRR